MPTVILRPAGDMSNKGWVASAGSDFYNLVNETATDDDATYMYVNNTSATAGQNGATHVFKMECSKTIVRKVRIHSIRIFYRGRLTNYNNNDSGYTSLLIILNIGGIEYRVSSVYTFESINYVDVDATYTQVTSGGTQKTNLSDIEINKLSEVVFTATLTANGYKGSSKNDNFQTRITQCYAEVNYEEIDESSSSCLYFKSNSSYAQAAKVYKKVSGSWVEQTDVASLFDGASSGSSTNYVYGGSVQ